MKDSNIWHPYQYKSNSTLYDVEIVGGGIIYVQMFGASGGRLGCLGDVHTGCDCRPRGMEASV